MSSVVLLYGEEKGRQYVQVEKSIRSEVASPIFQRGSGSKRWDGQRFNKVCRLQIISAMAFGEHIDGIIKNNIQMSNLGQEMSQMQDPWCVLKEIVIVSGWTEQEWTLALWITEWLAKQKTHTGTTAVTTSMTRHWTDETEGLKYTGWMIID